MKFKADEITTEETAALRAMLDQATRERDAARDHALALSDRVRELREQLAETRSRLGYAEACLARFANKSAENKEAVRSFLECQLGGEQ